MRKNIYSVGQVNPYIQNMFAQDFMLHQISIKGEVSNCKYHSSGHIYFTLKDQTGTIAAVMFSRYRRGLAFQMKEGDKVVVTGSVEVYERDGKYQLYAREIELEGAGNLYLKYEALKRELEEMGMFDAAYKKPIPRYATRIGIVTAPTGAAIQDIRNIAARRNPYVQLILYPALVQGDGAAASIVRGIHALDVLGVDVIIVGRGGGSIEDLWAFNDERVARAIYNSEIPVISAVGHEPDVTIADFVADRRASTPLNAAEIAVPDMAELLRALQSAGMRMTQAEMNLLGKQNERLDALRKKRALTEPFAFVQDRRMQLDFAQQRLAAAAQSRLGREEQRFARNAAALDAMSPLKVLGRGYAMVQAADGSVLRSARQVQTGDRIEVRLGEGTLGCRVEEKKEV